MTPLNIDTPGNKCTQSIPATCIPYNGNKITCINTCNTDMVSDVLYKLGMKECYLESLIDLSTIDLSCIYTSCPNCQNPTTIAAVIQILINTLCTQAAQIAALQTCCNKLNAGY